MRLGAATRLLKLGAHHRHKLVRVLEVSLERCYDHAQIRVQVFQPGRKLVHHLRVVLCKHRSQHAGPLAVQDQQLVFVTYRSGCPCARGAPKQIRACSPRPPRSRGRRDAEASVARCLHDLSRGFVCLHSSGKLRKTSQRLWKLQRYGSYDTSAVVLQLNHQLRPGPPLVQSRAHTERMNRRAGGRASRALASRAPRVPSYYRRRASAGTLALEMHSTVDSVTVVEKEQRTHV